MRPFTRNDHNFVVHIKPPDDNEMLCICVTIISFDFLALHYILPSHITYKTMRFTSRHVANEKSWSMPNQNSSKKTRELLLWRRWLHWLKCYWKGKQMFCFEKSKWTSWGQLNGVQNKASSWTHLSLTPFSSSHRWLMTLCMSWDWATNTP